METSTPLFLTTSGDNAFKHDARSDAGRPGPRTNSSVLLQVRERIIETKGKDPRAKEELGSTLAPHGKLFPERACSWRGSVTALLVCCLYISRSTSSCGNGVPSRRGSISTEHVTVELFHLSIQEALSMSKSHCRHGYGEKERSNEVTEPYGSSLVTSRLEEKVETG